MVKVNTSTIWTSSNQRARDLLGSARTRPLADFCRARISGHWLSLSSKCVWKIALGLLYLCLVSRESCLTMSVEMYLLSSWRRNGQKFHSLSGNRSLLILMLSRMSISSSRTLPSYRSSRRTTIRPTCLVSAIMKSLSQSGTSLILKIKKNVNKPYSTTASRTWWITVMTSASFAISSKPSQKTTQLSIASCHCQLCTLVALI